MKNLIFVFALSFIAIISYNEIQAQTTPTKAVPSAQYYEGGQTAMYAFINSQVLYPPLQKEIEFKENVLFRAHLKQMVP